MTVVERFQGEWRAFSNYAHGWTWLTQADNENVSGWGEMYPTVEHAFAAVKSLDPKVRKAIQQTPGGLPGVAKRKGRSCQLRPDWETESTRRGWPECRQIMRRLVIRKFEANHDLTRLLLSTGSDQLTESNDWHDVRWGKCVCPRSECSGEGTNWLGRILMDARTMVGYINGGRHRGMDHIIAVAGHRPGTLPEGRQDWIERELGRVLEKLDPLEVVSGMALGPDQWAAEWAKRAQVDLCAIIPSPRQPLRWSPVNQVRWRKMLDEAAEVVCVARPEVPLSASLLFTRNGFVVRRCSTLVAVYDGRPDGGTAGAVAEAERIGRRVIQIDPIERRTFVRGRAPRQSEAAA